MNAGSPRPRHARYAASLIGGLAPAAESDTTTARPCTPARKQSVGDLVVGPGLQEKSAQHFLPVGLLIANIDNGVGIERHNAVYRVPIMTRRFFSQHYWLEPNSIEDG